MFGKNDNRVDRIDTLIGKSTTIEGKIEAQGTIRLDGTLKGDMVVEGSIIIGEGAKVTGNLNCSNVFVSGIVEGNITCKDQLRITSTGKVIGDIDVKNFIVDENAIFEGNCKMRGNSSTIKDVPTIEKEKVSKGA